MRAGREGEREGGGGGEGGREGGGGGGRRWGREGEDWKSVRLAAAILEKEVDTLAPAITSMQRGGIVYNPVTSVMCAIKKNFATELDIGWILVLLGISLMKIVIEEPCLGDRNSVNDTLYRFPVSQQYCWEGHNKENCKLKNNVDSLIATCE